MKFEVRGRKSNLLGGVCFFTIGLVLASLGRAENAATAPATQPATAPMAREFTSDKFHFRVKYPAGWLVPPQPIGTEVFSARTPAFGPKDARFGAVGLRIDQGPQGRSDRSILMELSAAMAGYIFNHGGKKVTIRPDQLGNLPARRVRFISDQPSGPVATMYVVAVKHRIEYVFSIAAPAEKFDELLPAVETMLKSFEVLE